MKQFRKSTFSVLAAVAKAMSYKQIADHQIDRKDVKVPEVINSVFDDYSLGCGKDTVTDVKVTSSGGSISITMNSSKYKVIHRDNNQWAKTQDLKTKLKGGRLYPGGGEQLKLDAKSVKINKGKLTMVFETEKFFDTPDLENSCEELGFNVDDFNDLLKDPKLKGIDVLIDQIYNNILYAHNDDLIILVNVGVREMIVGQHSDFQDICSGISNDTYMDDEKRPVYLKLDRFCGLLWRSDIESVATTGPKFSDFVTVMKKFTVLEYGDKTTYLNKPYFHSIVPKNKKKGVRLISAPRYDLKVRSSVMNEVFNVVVPTPEEFLDTYMSPIPIKVLSYYKGSDFVKTITETDFSVKAVGSKVLQIDFKDFFTNITPKMLKATMRIWSTISGKSREEIMHDLVKASTELEGPVKEMLLNLVQDLPKEPVVGANAARWYNNINTSFQFIESYSDIAGHDKFGSSNEDWMHVLLQSAHNILGPCIPISSIRQITGNYNYTNRVAEMLTDCLPLWRVNLYDVDLDTVDEEEIKRGKPFAIEHRIKDMKKNIDPGKSLPNMYYLNQRASFKPWKQRGVPQGSCFSGIIANMVALVLSRYIINHLRGVMANLNAEMKTAILYSDNLYIFYEGEGTFQNIFQNELIGLFKGGGKFRELKRFLTKKKISVVDRDRRDVKILGILIDAEGTKRLSRETRRRVNQHHIHRYKEGRTHLTTSEKGKDLWYKRVRALAGETPYKRKLINE